MIDLSWLESEGVLAENGKHWSQLHESGKRFFNHHHLNSFIDLGKDVWHETRQVLQLIFGIENKAKYESKILEHAAFAANEVELHMPVFIRDYTDFYSSKNHAMNMGIMFRGKDNALMPNWVHIPIGYHGRASSVVITGTEIIRPKGQVSADKVNPTWSKCNRMDYEVEMGLIVGKTNKLGQPVKITEAHDHIFGLCVVNDWSARDMQVWEYQPLGPFNAKNFATTISPWIVTMEALEPFKVPLSAQDPKPLDYLYEKDLYSYDVKL